jgi:hypothetical protein
MADDLIQGEMINWPGAKNRNHKQNNEQLQPRSERRQRKHQKMFRSFVS